MLSTVNFAIAAGAADEHYMVDWDGTVILQLVVFLATWFFAKKLIFTPYLKLRERRAAGIEGARTEAQSLSSEADTKFSRYQERLAEARSSASDARMKIRSEASDKQRDISERAREEVNKSWSEAQATITKESDKARQELLPKADEIARSMATQLLGREVAQ